MRKFLKPVSFLIIVMILMSVSVGVFATDAENNPAVQDIGFGTLNSETGELIITSLSELGMTEIPAGFASMVGVEMLIRIIKIEDKGIATIGAGAFSNCFRLEKVYFPETVTVIDESAFWGCPDNFKVYAPRGSVAEEFADAKGYTYKEYSGEEKDTEGSISEGVSVTVLGVGVVFLILIILCIVLKIFEIAFGPKKKAAPAAPVAQVQKPVAPSAQADDTELVAVISAAIAASLGTSTSSFKIKSLRRLGSGWNQAAKLQNFNNNF